jgi:glycosyltransferase involved in cell wall biosynthesis
VGAAGVRVVLLGSGVHPIPPTGYGGVERTIAEFSRALTVAGDEVTIVNEVRRERGTDEYRFALGLPRRLRTTPYDVLHASTPVVANRLRWSGLPYIYTSHSRHWFDRPGWRGQWGYRLERRAVRGAAHTVALTERLRRTMAADAGADAAGRMSVIPIGVDLDRFHPSWDRRTGKVVLGVGVVAPFKRWEVAARALRGTGLTLRIAGPAPDNEYARQVRTSGENVELLGEVSEDRLAELFATADLLMHPSRVELLAGVVLQGLAAGLPVLGADPIADLIPAGAGSAAPETADEAGLEQFLSEGARAYAADAGLRRAAGEAARAGARERYGWPAVAGAHQAIYRRLLDAGELS